MLLHSGGVAVFLATRVATVRFFASVDSEMSFVIADAIETFEAEVTIVLISRGRRALGMNLKIAKERNNYLVEKQELAFGLQKLGENIFIPFT